MKKIIFSLVLITVAISLIAQSPQAFNYQTVVRNNAGEILASQNVSFQISILEGSTTGTAVYVETHDTITNEFGLINLKIGNGDMVTGVFANIDWGSNIYFLQIELDENGEANYLFIGTSQLLSVPYALYSGFTGDTTRWKKNNDDLYYNNGSIGIGTHAPSPSTKLDIRGNLFVDGKTTITNLDIGQETALNLSNTVSNWELVASSDNNLIYGNGVKYPHLV